MNLKFLSIAIIAIIPHQVFAATGQVNGATITSVYCGYQDVYNRQIQHRSA